MRKTILGLLLAFCVLCVSACELIKSPDYYELNDEDKIISFTKVVGERKVNTKKIDMTHAVQRIAYSYKELENAFADSEKYINYLMDEEGFVSKDFIELDEEDDEITLRKDSSMDTGYEIRVVVKYSNSSQSVKVTVEREKVIS